MRTPESIAYARIGARGSAPGPALAAVADSLRRALPSNCYPTCVADTDPQTPALDYDCSFIAQWTEAGEFHQRFVFPCEGEHPPAGEDVCVSVRTADERTVCADEGFNLELGVRRAPGAELPEGFGIRPLCRPSADRAVDCPELP